MFTSQLSHSSSDFVVRSETGFITPFPAIAYCKLAFDTASYRDALFSEYAIPFPTALDKAVVKRRAEYLAVRYAARQLLKTAGCDGHVGTSPGREPVWPAGWCGSLSHTRGHAIAIIAPRNAGLTPGIDIEMFDASAMRETAEMFTSPEERRLLAACGLAYETALLIVFSAKESLFKALYPEVKCFFGFEAARIRRIDTAAQSFTLELTQLLTPERKQGCQFNGQYLIEENRVITLIA
ncbi:4'-phosphopantetheinyl transferase superfamily protein [Kosakonia sacchari]|uniref:4'-phosphopantetheinyl transferase family protein n=1 Tax=Kosakonia sacchari TaxID=1158459 RepID=UPI002ACEBBA6|nr:4'-phosphopantetheinyl transferase superfamily protein [Kosakonia sacchari]MDZ7323445.1 4'-phosphopantetheinyl transferase superfamily protein [Kosakonia sacchari]